jgi:hypothetical protein
MIDDQKDRVVRLMGATWEEMAGDAEDLGGTTKADAIELVLDADRLESMASRTGDPADAEALAELRKLSYDDQKTLARRTSKSWY